MKNKAISFVLAFQIILCVLSPALVSVFAESEVLNISSAEDFVAFSKQCTLDSTSLGKTYDLMCDIDFSGIEFVPVPSFSGTFKGNGYTISGIKYDKKGSDTGVFRYITESGAVRDLNIKASVTPGGSKSDVGGIVGNNSGTVENCTFEGSVKGDASIGGIAGINRDSGKIFSSTVKGEVDGENFTGGICGKNSGFIKDCVNEASVNTVYEEKESNLDDVETDAEAIVENIKTAEESKTEEESVLENTDTGGISGYSSGIIQGCTNNGCVGYQHIGYNIGGIAGRQAGYILGCRNFGEIKGRKDIGGIVGQAEPYIILNTTESALGSAKDELDSLNEIIDKLIADGDNLGDSVSLHLKDISKYAEDARENTDILMREGENFVDDNLSEINAQAAILSNTLDKMSTVFDAIENSGDNLGNALEKTSDALKNLDLYFPNLNDDINALTSALRKVSNSEQDIKKAVARLNRAKDKLKSAAGYKDSAAAEAAVSDISVAIGDIEKAKSEINSAIEEIDSILRTNPIELNEAGLDTEKLIEDLGTVKDGITKTLNAIETIKTSVDTLKSNAYIDFSAIKTAAGYADEAIGYLAEGLYSITGGLKKLSTAIGDLNDTLLDYNDDISEELSVAKNTLTEAIDALALANEDIGDGVTDLKNIVADLADEKPLEFVKTGDEFRTAGEKLYGAVSGISEGLNGLKDTIHNDRYKLSDDLTSVNNKLNTVLNLLAGEYDRVKDGGKSVSDIFVDVSDEDIEGVKQGKVEDCQNFGQIEADRNVGGIAGMMAIEYSKDPEDDLEKPDALSFTYQSRAVLQSCINDGKVIGKKDCAGGMTGRAEIGTVYKCENYGDIESTNGGYVGGIIGKSEASVRKSYAKSKASGTRYVGGIAGKGKKVISSYSIANVKGDENIGAVCGGADDRGSVYCNRFTDNGVGGIDGISYKSSAEPITFDELKTISGIPPRFISFTVTFVADGVVVETQDIEYGDSTKKIKYPEIPEKEGHFGNWQKTDAETVSENIVIECEYKPYITVISSSEKDENGKLSIALAEGKFNDKAKISIKESEVTAPNEVGSNAKVYDINILNGDIERNKTFKIRILNDTKDRGEIYVKNGDEWEKVKSSSRGKYVIFETSKENLTFCLNLKKIHRTVIIICVILIAVAVVGIILLKKFNKKLRNRA